MFVYIFLIICICVCIYVYVYMCVHVYVCMYICICVYMYVYTIYAYMYMCVCMYVCVCMCICVYVYMYICVRSISWRAYGFLWCARFVCMCCWVGYLEIKCFSTSVSLSIVINTKELMLHLFFIIPRMPLLLQLVRVVSGDINESF